MAAVLRANGRPSESKEYVIPVVGDLAAVVAALTSAIALALDELKRRRSDAVFDPDDVRVALMTLHGRLQDWNAAAIRTNSMVRRLSGEMRDDRADPRQVIMVTEAGIRNLGIADASMAQLRVTFARKMPSLDEVLGVYEPSLADLMSLFEERMQHVARVTRNPERWLRESGPDTVAADLAQLEATHASLEAAAENVAAFIGRHFPLAPG